MTDSDSANLIYGLLCLVLVGSSLAIRRVPIGETLKMVAAWVGIFAALFAVLLFRSDLAEVWRRAKVDVLGPSAEQSDGTLRIRAGEGGHFYTSALVNGKSLEFLVDTGATITSLSLKGANRAGIEVDEKAFPVIVQTANGVAADRRARVGEFRLGPIMRKDMAIHVSEGLDELNILGMNFLTTLKGWKVEGDELILNP